MNKLAVLDVDGVLANFEGKVVACLESEFGGIATQNRHEFSFEKRWASHGNVLKRALLYTNTPNFYKSIEPNVPMIQFAETLIDLSFGVMFLTSRPKTHEEVTRRWLERNIGNYAQAFGLFVDVNDKADFISDMYPDFLIDDNPEEIARCKERRVMGLCYDQPWNTGIFPRIVHDRNGEVYLQLSDDKEPFHLIDSYKLQES